jgi:hypothetical protein
MVGCIREEVWLEPNLFPYAFYTHLLACEDGTERVFRNVGI